MHLSYIHHNCFWRVKAIQFAIHFLERYRHMHTHSDSNSICNPFLTEIQTHTHTFTQSIQENVIHKHMKVSVTYTNIYWYECYILLVSSKILIFTLELPVKDYPDTRPSLLSGHFFWYLPFYCLMQMSPWPRTILSSRQLLFDFKGGLKIQVPLEANSRWLAVSVGKYNLLFPLHRLNGQQLVFRWEDFTEMVSGKNKKQVSCF